MTGAVAKFKVIDRRRFRGGVFERGIRGRGTVTA